VARAFIVRPFGEKKFGKKQIAVNFDTVEKSLIEPALKNLNIEGRTTAEILESGNIRNDMFQRLLVSDLVIADLTVHNANVFYELGIRHALREKRTFLIYSRIGDEDIPFDLRTDRYLAYDHQAPEKSLPALIAGLRRTLASDEKDSPVFRLLPSLRSQDPGRFMVAPEDFLEEVQHAEDRGAAGDLALLAVEVAGVVWEREGLRLVGRAQSRSSFLAAARDTWERVLRLDDKDAEANLELGAIYQMLGEIDRSHVILKRVLDHPAAEPGQKARAHALRARNAMQYWQRSVAAASPGNRQAEALTSPRLEESYEEFRRGFELDLREYRLGIEALAQLTVWTTLAEQLPDAWTDAYYAPEEAAQRLVELRQHRVRLTATVELALEIARKRPDAPPVDLRIARAQLTLLTSVKSERVRSAFSAAVEYALPSDFSALSQFLAGFAGVDVLAANVAAALQVLASRAPAPVPANAPSRVLLYRGYGPELIAHEDSLSAWIRASIEAEIASAGGSDRLVAIAGGACGGDILFHELCQELKVVSLLHMPFSPEQYIARFVQCGDPRWIERFRKVNVVVPRSILQSSPEMPRWLKDRETYEVVERWNSWVLAVARSLAEDITLIAVCDEARADDEGVVDCVRKARQGGVKPVIIDPARLIAGLQ